MLSGPVSACNGQSLLIEALRLSTLHGSVGSMQRCFGSRLHSQVFLRWFKFYFESLTGFFVSFLDRQLDLLCAA